MPNSKNTSDRLTVGESAAVRCEQADAATLRLHVSGRWKIYGKTPAADEVLQQAQSQTGLTRITVDAQQVAAWDSTLITFLLRLQTHCSQKGLTFDPQGLPSGIQGLLKLATAVPAREGARRTSEKEPFLSRPRRCRAAGKGRSRRGPGLHRRGISGALPIFRGKSPVPTVRPARVHVGLRPARRCRSWP